MAKYGWACSWTHLTKGSSLRYYLPFVNISMRKNQRSHCIPSKDIEVQKIFQSGWMRASNLKNRIFPEKCLALHCSLLPAKSNNKSLSKLNKTLFWAILGHSWYARQFFKDHFFCFYIVLMCKISQYTN